MSRIGFYFDQTRCTGCFACQVACKDWHDIDAGPVKWITLLEIEEGKFPNPFLAYLIATCYHCENPACQKACPADAIEKMDDTGIVLVDPAKCQGKDDCGALCQKACPWDAPQFGPEQNACMQKCDLCCSRLAAGQNPICVDACPMFAMDAGPMEGLKEKYGDAVEAKGFRRSKKLGPSIIFKSK